MGDTFVAYCLGNFSSPSGVLEEPFGILCDYSILLNVYLVKKEKEVSIEKTTITTLKQNKVLIDGKTYIQTRLLYDLINEEKDNNIKEKLISDNNILINRVLGTNIKHDIRKEYLIPNVGKVEK